MESAGTSRSNSDDDEPYIPKIIVGVCAMDKKVSGKPMKEILRRIADFEDGMFEIIVFGDDCILRKPIEEWPIVHTLIAFFSSGFPLEKAEAYVELRKPFCVNNLSSEHLLRDRRKFYSTLTRHHIPVPFHVVLNRDGYEGKPDSVVEEFEDYVVVDGVRVNKPFVEKPVDAEDHNVYIYYPRAQGGGSKRLFRKVGDKSSAFYPDVSTIRTEGSYIYEEFMMTQGTDIKIYAVGRGYAHAEARKSPTLDGKVQRDKEGKEVRYPIMLTAREKWMAQEVCAAFKQNVVGCDLLRTHDRSYICDVNGWSFVKKSKKYYDDTSHVLIAMMIRAIRPELLSKAGFHELSQPIEYVRAASSSADGGLDVTVSEPRGEELRCMVAIIRHGDRTAKQKLKLLTSHPLVIKLTESYTRNTDGSREKEAKLKTAVELGSFLDTVKAIVTETLEAAADYHGSDYDANDAPDHHVEMVKWLQMKSVLEKEKFSGINRKAQLKWVKSPEKDKSTVLIVLKWGGVLTHAGVRQAMELGKWFRSHLYPGESTGLLRLHSSFRHDLKIYSSDEGRVQMTAAAFAKGLLDLDGDLTPILASLVRSFNTNDMLDDTRCALAELGDIKSRLRAIFTREMAHTVVETPSGADNTPAPAPLAKALVPVMSEEDLIDALCPARTASSLKAIKAVGTTDLRAALLRVHSTLEAATKELEALAHTLEPLEGLPGTVVAEIELATRRNLSHDTSPLRLTRTEAPTSAESPAISTSGAGKDGPVCCGGESLWLVLQRWKKLTRDFYNKRKDRFDISKVPDIYDILKYYRLHNSTLNLSGINEVYPLCKALADLVVPQEYGITHEEKRVIGTEITHHLMRKVMFDLTAGRPSPVPAAAPLRVVSEPTVVTAKTPMLASAGVDTPRPLRLPTALAPAVKQPSPKVQSKAPAPADAARPVSDLATVAATTINVYDRGDMDAPVGSPSSLPVANVEMMPLIGLEAGPDRSRTFSVKSAHESSVASMASQRSSDLDQEPFVSPTLIVNVARRTRLSGSNLEIMAPDASADSSSVTGGVPYVGSDAAMSDRGDADTASFPGHDTNESEVHETVHVLDQTSFQPDEFVDSKTSTAHVRTRLYFTSESHVQSLLNALYQWSALAAVEGRGGLFSDSGVSLLSETTELDYLSHIVFRLFENFDVPRDDPKRTRVEVLFSPGASVDPGSGRPYPPYDSLSASETHLHLSSELSGSLLKSHSVPLNTSSSPNSSRPTSTHGSRASARGRGFGRSSSAFAVGAAATPPLPPSAAPGPPPSLFDQENHTLGVLPCIPLSPPSLTLGYIEALLLRAIESVGADGASTGKSY